MPPPPQHRRRRIARIAGILAAFAIVAWAPAASADPILGFNDSWDPLPPQADAAANDLEARVGARIDRIVISWADVEARLDANGRAVQDWFVPDRRIRAIENAGMRPLIIVTGSPKWAHNDPLMPCHGRPVFCPPVPAHLDDWQRFVYDVTRRYPRAVGIEVWNEPNLLGCWPRNGGPDPAAYAELFTKAAGAIHFADPTMPVLIGSLVYFHEDQQRGLSIPTFLRRFFAAGGGTSLRPRWDRHPRLPLD